MPDERDLLQSSLGPSYTIERELGGGGMSRVFVAEEHALGRKVVVKMLPPELTATVSMERFKREILLAARLQHPHIVPLLTAGDADGLLWFSMPLVEGESLRARLDRGPTPVGEATDILRDMALALEYAHAHDVVHRDIKPENILLTGRSAMVTDFGIARAITAASAVSTGATLTGLGMIVGTPAYMAPEQAAGEAAGPRADIYAWGLIAYEMLSGAHPFAPRTSAQSVIAAHIAEQPVPLRERRSDLPLSLTTLVDSCLAKDPDDRPADATALLERLGASNRQPARRRLRAVLVPAVVVMCILAGTAAWFWRQSERRHWAREDAIPAMTRLAEDQPLAAFRLLAQARKYLPGDTTLARVADGSTRRVSVTSSPSGATVSIQDYLEPDSAWYQLGVTPLANVMIPAGYFRWKVSKPGVGDYVTAPITKATMAFALDSSLGAPKGMVRVAGTTWLDFIAFMGVVGPFKLPPFYIDRFEVTNREYQDFVDKGGYTNPAYWQQKFVRQNHELGRNEAMALFHDRTDRPGPSTWEGGHFPEGRADYPVSGISWYEAMAYAAFAGKSLPSFPQWYEAAPSGIARFVVRESNISRSGVAPVATFKGIGPFGTYDMAGNVREWALNAVDVDLRFILGGAANSQSYQYTDPEALSAFDRSPDNGVRCVRNVVPLAPDVSAPITPLRRDFAAVHPASDEVFAAYRAMYAYQKTPLNAKVEGVVQDGRDWTKEKITYDAAYGHERMTAYLYLPKGVKPPYQAVLFFPSARVYYIPPDSRFLGDTSFFDYIVQSGRAVLYPVYQDTYERRARRSDPGGSQEIDLTIQRSRDVGRSLDYLQTRPDIAADKLAYLGVSMGAAEGVRYATLEQKRLKTVIFLDGGFYLSKPPAGGDAADFAPRLRVPVLMVNGRYDFSFSLNESQVPLFRMLGTPDADKRHVILDTPHDVRAQRPALVGAVLGWLDRYLGKVR